MIIDIFVVPENVLISLSPHSGNVFAQALLLQMEGRGGQL